MKTQQILNAETRQRKKFKTPRCTKHLKKRLQTYTNRFLFTSHLPAIRTAWSPVRSNHQPVWTTWLPVRYKHKPVRTAWSPVCCNRQPFQIMTWSPVHWKNQAIRTTWSPNHWKHHSVRTAWPSVHLKHWAVRTTWSPVCPFQTAWSLLEPFERLELFSIEWWQG